MIHHHQNKARGADKTPGSQDATSSSSSASRMSINNTTDAITGDHRTGMTGDLIASIVLLSPFNFVLFPSLLLFCVYSISSSSFRGCYL